MNQYKIKYETERIQRDEVTIQAMNESEALKKFRDEDFAYDAEVTSILQLETIKKPEVDPDQLMLPLVYK